MDTETNPDKLVNYVCGSNYKIEGEDVKLGPDSDYPDWLFTMNVKRPKPKSWEIEDKNSEAFFKACQLEAMMRWKRLSKRGLIGLKDRK